MTHGERTGTEEERSSRPVGRPLHRYGPDENRHAVNAHPLPEGHQSATGHYGVSLIGGAPEEVFCHIKR